MRCMGMDLSWVGSALVTVDVTDDGQVALAREPLLLNRGSKGKFKGKALLGVENLAYVVDAIETELDEAQPDLVALEDYSGGRGPKPFVLAQLGEVGGAARLAMHYRDLRWVEVAAATLKKFVTGKGRGKKHVILEGCYKRWGVGSETLGDDDNVIDAYCLARFAAAILLEDAGGYSLFRYEVEAIKKARVGGSGR